LADAIARICDKRKPLYYVESRAYGSNRNNSNRNNNNSEVSDQKTLNEVIAMIRDPRSTSGASRPEVVLRPPNFPPPKQFVNDGRAFAPVKDDVQPLPLVESQGEPDAHNTWMIPLAALAALAALFGVAWWQKRDGCPLLLSPPKDDPPPMVGKYETSLPVKMKDLKKAEVVMGRPQKDNLKTWSEIEKNWNTTAPNAGHKRAGHAAPAEGDARFASASLAAASTGEEEEEEEEVEVSRPVQLRREAPHRRRNMDLEIGKTGICKDDGGKKTKYSERG